MKEAIQEGVHTIWFHLCKILEDKIIYCDRKQISCLVWRYGNKEREGGNYKEAWENFQDDRNAYYLDYGFGNLNRCQNCMLEIYTAYCESFTPQTCCSKKGECECVTYQKLITLKCSAILEMTKLQRSRTNHWLPRAWGQGWESVYTEKQHTWILLRHDGAVLYLDCDGVHRSNVHGVRGHRARCVHTHKWMQGFKNWWEQRKFCSPVNLLAVMYKGSFPILMLNYSSVRRHH